MQNEDCEARTLVALAVGVGLGVIIGAGAYATAYPIFQSDNWAAWASAVATATASIVALHVAHRARSGEHKKQLGGAIIVAHQIRHQLVLARHTVRHEILPIFAEGFNSSLHRGQWERCGAALVELNINISVEQLVQMEPLGKEISHRIAVCQSIIGAIKYNISDIDFETATSASLASASFEDTKQLLNLLLMHLIGALRDIEPYRRVVGNKPPTLESAEPPV